MTRARAGSPASAAPTEDAGSPAGQHGSGGAFPIVGIGASAGGLEAFSALLKHLPLDTGMGFVLVQHLDPHHESALPELLARATALPVREAANHLRVEPDHIYVIPPNTNLGITAGVLTLSPRPVGRTPFRSIDSFLGALAADQRERAIGIILSGTATDGTLGLEAIKAEGGITFAQDDSARYDSMPRSAIAAGCVDFVLSPQGIATELARVATHPAVAASLASASTPAAGPHDEAAIGAALDTGVTGDQTEAAFNKVLLLLRNHSGVDFSLYKSTTIRRRIVRRMVLGRQQSLDRYADALRGNTDELKALYADTLISVTSFFRNPEAFEVLQEVAWPTLLRQAGDDPLRVWVLGCSTGQEAYSLAMTFMEAADQVPHARKLQVFATDLNDALLQKARRGFYAKNLTDDVSPTRLRRFFTEEEGGYRVSKALREMVVFARQNAISDPPFSRMDLISCRNVLIYFDPALQKKIFPVFHYALRPDGFLWLGASESIGAFTQLFEPVDKKQKIFTRKTASLPVAPPPKTDREPSRPAGSRIAEASAGRASEQEGVSAELQAQREADRLAVSQFAPPGVLIDADLRILQFRGLTSAYLAPPAGKATFDLLKMARPGLMLPLRAVINKAKTGNAAARKENITVDRDGTAARVHVEVIPLKNLRERYFLVVFEDAGPTGRARPAAAQPRAVRQARGAQARRIAELEAELAETRDYLQAMQEQHDGTNDDLQASNEEVQSANEELQSINEELETSKEELESANEELITVNEEMTTRNTELNRLNSDLLNVQTSASQAIVLLGRNLDIRRFSTQAGKQFNLLAADIGRPIGQVRHHLDVPDLDRFINGVIDTARPGEREVQDQDGHWFSLRVRPYLTTDNAVDGAVLVLVDIDALKRSEQAIAAARDYAAAIVRTARDPLLILNADLRVNTANEAFYRMFKLWPAQTEGRFVHELGDGAWNLPALRQLFEDVLTEDRAFDDFEVSHEVAGAGRRTMLLNARRMTDADGRPIRILLGIQDVTEAFEIQAAVRVSQARYQALVEASAQIVWTTDATGAVVEDSPSWRAFTGQTVAERQRSGWLDAIHPHDRAQTEDRWLRAVSERTPVDIECRIRDDRGGWRWAQMRAVPVSHHDGSVREWIGMNTDVTVRRQAEEQLRESQLRFTQFMRHLPGLAWIKDADGRYLYANDGAQQAAGRDRDALYGKTDQELFPLAMAAQLRKNDQQALDKESSIQTVETLTHADGSVHQSVVNTFAIPGPDDKSTMVGGIAIDVTELRETEAALRAGERSRAENARARLAAIVESSDDAIISKDIDGIITSWNLGAEQLFGYTADEAIGQPVLLIIPLERLEEEASILARIRRGVIVDHFETVRCRKDGTLFDVSVTVSPIRDSAGDVVGASKIARDITDEKRINEALRESDRRKDEFLAMLAHELRNPLASIRNALEIMHRAKAIAAPQTASAAENSTPASPSRAVAHPASLAEDVLERQVSHMVRLVDDLLDAGRISRGKLALYKEPIELSSVIHHAVDAARPLFDAQEQNLTLTLPADVVYLEADPTRLAQMVGNLLNNASKFTGRGGDVWLTVERDGQAMDGVSGAALGQVIIRVKDTGIGIAADQLLRVFDLFTQVDTSLERSVSGLGIGLTLVRKLAQMHGGTVDARSAGVGHGSEFVLRLPIAEEAAPPVIQTAQPEALATPSLRVLIVDDNLDAAEMLATLLGFSGHVTHLAHSGLTAVAAAAALRPDAILLDIGLPDLNGYESARRIRAQQDGTRPVLIALTGWGQEEDRRRSAAAGFDAHLVKPVDGTVLVRLLTDLVRRQNEQS